MEPTPADVAAVNNFIGGQPQAQPQAAPQPQQPTEQPAEQPAQPSDPFASYGQPVQPTEPVAQPTEPVAQAQPQQPAQPAAPAQPAQPAQPQQTYDEYLASIAPPAAELPQMPDPTKIDPNSDEGIQTFFQDLISTAVAQAESNVERKMAIRNNEQTLWTQTFEQYPSLRTNKEVRDIIQDIRMSSFRRGQPMTPSEAAQRFLEHSQQQYQRGVVDNQVHTTIENVQPNGGQSVPVSTSGDRQEVLTGLQSGGETALANYLDGEIRAGRM